MRRARQLLAILICLFVLGDIGSLALAEPAEGAASANAVEAVAEAASEGEAAEMSKETSVPADAESAQASASLPAEGEAASEAEMLPESSADETLSSEPATADETAPAPGAEASPESSQPPAGEASSSEPMTTAPDAEAIPESSQASAGETPAPSESVSPEATLESPAPTEADPSATPALSLADEPDFCRGYARLQGEAFCYADADPESEPLFLLEGGVVYVLSRETGTECDRLECAFDGDGTQQRVWIDAADLTSMTAEEATAFAQARAADPNARCLEEDAAIFLDALNCIQPVANVLLMAEAVPETPVMQVAQTEITLGVKESFPLNVSFSDGESHAVSFTSRNTRVAKVSADGKVTAKKRGETTVYIKSEFGEEAQVRVRVKKAPTKVTLSASRALLGVGESLQLTAKLSSGSASRLSFSTSDASIASVDADGVVSALSPGSVTLSVSCFNGKKAKLKLRVAKAPESVSLPETALTLGVGMKHAFAAQLPENSAGACLFSSDNPTVLEIQPDTGAAEAKAPGVTNVSVQTYNGKSFTCAVTVKPAPSCVSLAQTELVLGVGERVTLPEVQMGASGEDCMGSYTLKSSNSKRVTVNASGEICAKRTGSATITLTTQNQLTAKLKVTVKRAPKKLSLSPKSLTLGVQESAVLKASLPSKTAGGVRFESSDSGIVAVDASGRVTGVAPGEATVTAISYNNKRAKCKITVKCAPESVSLPEALTLGAGEKYTLTAQLLPAESAGSCEYWSDNPNVVTAGSGGALKAVAPGSTLVHARSYNNCETACAVTVKAAPTGVAFQEKSVTLAVGDRYTLLKPVLSGEDAFSAGLSYKSSNKKYVKVNAAGEITGVRAGKAKLTVNTYNGKKATIWVYVKKPAKSVAFAQSSLQLYIDQTHTPELKFSGGAACSYSLSSSNPAWRPSRAAIPFAPSAAAARSSPSSPSTEKRPRFN